MFGIISIWTGLSVARRAMLVGSVAATIFAFVMLAKTASTPSMTLLYSGLDPSSAGDVISELERMDVPTEIRQNSIFVPANRRDAVRMALAREGLPQQGQAGYELFENLNGFSTTSDIFDVTYWRAMEGELARTILATPGVKSARVHIAHDRSTAFSRNAPQPKGVVTVTMARGTLSVSQAQAIRFMVSSSVPALSAEQVAVLDSNRGVILSPGEMEASSAIHSNIGEREQSIERDVLNLLEARVGSGNARVQVAVEVDTEREAISERVIDPAGRVISGKQTTEITEKSSGSNSSSVSVASNLPEGDASAGGGRSNSDRTQTDESVSYDLSEIRREREKLPGSIKRISVAVLVNQIEESDASAQVMQTPRTAEEVEALRELVAGAIGFNEERGDTITIHSMPFKSVPVGGVEVEQGFAAKFVERNLVNVIQVGILSIVTLILGLFVVKPVLATKSPPEALSISPPTSAPSNDPAVAADPVEALQVLASENSAETVELIQSWLEEREDAA